jgi:hypothetical protein
MPATHDVTFSTLADPTRRAIFERLCRDGEQTVRALTDRAGVSQPAVSSISAFSSMPAWCTTGATDARPTTAPSRKV